jgi:hypothetical protein
MSAARSISPNAESSPLSKSRTSLRGGDVLLYAGRVDVPSQRAAQAEGMEIYRRFSVCRPRQSARGFKVAQSRNALSFQNIKIIVQPFVRARYLAPPIDKVAVGFPYYFKRPAHIVLRADRLYASRNARCGRLSRLIYIESGLIVH